MPALLALLTCPPYPRHHDHGHQVMEEVIAKSKAYRAEKQQQREEDVEETERLDRELQGLLGTPGMLGMLRPKGAGRRARSAAEMLAVRAATLCAPRAALPGGCARPLALTWR